MADRLIDIGKRIDTNEYIGIYENSVTGHQYIQILDEETVRKYYREQSKNLHIDEATL